MTKASLNGIQQRDGGEAGIGTQQRADGPTGAAGLKTVDEMASVADGASEQSPASLPKMGAVIQMAESDNPGKASVQSPSGLKANTIATCQVVTQQK